MTIVLLGTSHVSKTAEQQIKKAVAQLQPSIIAVELDRGRARALLENKKSGFSLGAIRHVGVKGFAFASFAKIAQTLVGRWVKIQPGQDMKSAILVAHTQNIPVALIDQNIAVTLRKLSKKMTFREVAKGITDTIFGLFRPKRMAKKYGHIKFDVHNPSKKSVDAAIKYLEQEFPNIHEVLVHQRNVYMVKRLLKLQEQGHTILAVVGAGHVPGMQKLLDESIAYAVSGTEGLTIA